MLSVLVELSGLGLVEAALSQLCCTLLTARFSNALGVLVAPELDQLPDALDIVCGRYVLRAGQESTRPAPCHGTRRPGRARCSPCQSRQRWTSRLGTTLVEVALWWLLITAFGVPVAMAAQIKSS